MALFRTCPIQSGPYFQTLAINLARSLREVGFVSRAERRTPMFQARRECLPHITSYQRSRQKRHVVPAEQRRICSCLGSNFGMALGASSDADRLRGLGDNRTSMAVTFNANEEARVKVKASALGLTVEDLVAKAARDKANRVGWSCQDELHALISRAVSAVGAPKRSGR